MICDCFIPGEFFKVDTLFKPAPPTTEGVADPTLTVGALSLLVLVAYLAKASAAYSAYAMKAEGDLNSFWLYLELDLDYFLPICPISI